MTDPSPIILKVGGTTLEDQASAPVLWRAIAALSRSHPGGVVLVHGGGKAVDRHLSRLGFTTERRDGIRITPADQVDEIAGVLAGRINKQLVGHLNAAGAAAVGLCLGDGGAVRTVKATRYPFDPGRVGEIAPAIAGNPPRGDGRLLRTLLAAGYLPVLSSIGLDDDGAFLNINADDAAAALAGLLNAESLILLTDVAGIMDERREVVRELTTSGLEAMIASGVITGGMIPKARSAAETAQRTRTPVVILSGNDQSSLADYFAGRPVGTRITP